MKSDLIAVRPTLNNGRSTPVPLALYRNGYNEHTSPDGCDTQTTMTKTLRADMDEEAFYEFKGLFGKLDADTNDEAIEALVEHYKQGEHDIEDGPF